MSADGWTVSLPCTRAEAEAATWAELPGDPTVATSEPDPAAPDRWRIDVYLQDEPDPALLAAVAALAPGTPEPPVAARLPDADWVAESQRDLPPIRAGRFLVHTAAHEDAVSADATAFRIEAGRAFGTGHHFTTAGCLEMLDALHARGRRFESVVDLGTGTGLLAFAARALWPEAAVLATDIDPVAVEVARANMAANAIPAEAVALLVADGAAGLPADGFDLVLANILAGPLAAMAGDIVNIAHADATIVLAGLLATQADEVLAAYRPHGVRETDRLERGDWTILALERDGRRD